MTLRDKLSAARWYLEMFAVLALGREREPRTLDVQSLYCPPLESSSERGPGFSSLSRRVLAISLTLLAAAVVSAAAFFFA